MSEKLRLYNRVKNVLQCGLNSMAADFCNFVSSCLRPSKVVGEDRNTRIYAHLSTLREWTRRREITIFWWAKKLNLTLNYEEWCGARTSDSQPRGRGSESLIDDDRKTISWPDSLSSPSIQALWGCAKSDYAIQETLY
jgi:hypothetical protein